MNLLEEQTLCDACIKQENRRPYGKKPIKQK